MASLMNANLSSEDEEDDDYAPEDEGARKPALKRSRPSEPQLPDESAKASAQVQQDAEDTPQQQAKKAKIAAIWQQLNGGRSGITQSGAASSSAKPPSLSAICQPVKSGKTDSDQQDVPNQQQGSDMKSIAAKALAAAKEAASLATGRGAGRATITETRKFAGKDVQVTREVGKVSKEATKAADKKAAPASGLDAVLAEMEQKKKVNVLDKSKADWQDFKKQDTGVEEELEAYKRSSTQYLDKQQFLQRAEHREYEQERDKRLAADVRTRGRL